MSVYEKLYIYQKETVDKLGAISRHMIALDMGLTEKQ